MEFWESGFTPSEENSHLRDVYGIPDYVTSVENVFRVKRGVFKWSVVNLSRFPDPNKSGAMVFCHSPSYHLVETAWSLQLCPKATVNGQRGLSLRLSRDEDNPGPEKVLASYRLGVGKFDSSVWFGAKESTFWRGNFVQMNTSVLGYLEDFFDDGADGAYVICEVYVSYYPTHKVKDTAWQVSQVDESLPEDMSALLNSKHSMDVLIEIRGNQMWAHESVLSARSKTLGKRLKKDGNFFGSSYFGTKVMLQLSCSLLCLKCVLSYMYTGSFDYLARNAYFSIGLYEIADELCLFPLRDLFYPHKKCSMSRIHIDNIVENYKTQFNVRSFFSNTSFKIQGQHHKFTGLLVNILVYKIGQLPNYFVGFKLEISGISGGFYGETSLSLLDLNGRGVAARLLSQEVTPQGSQLTAVFVLTAPEFMCCDVMNESISVRVAYKIYQMKHDRIRPLGPPCSYNKPPLEPWCWREQLAEDLKAILLNGYSSDVTMMVEGQPFKVHRSILAARSPYFHSLFYGSDVAQSPVYRLENVKPHTFWLMLHYVYCGTLSIFHGLKIQDFMELFRVSANYGLASLVGISHIFMKMVVGKLDFMDS